MRINTLEPLLAANPGDAPVASEKKQKPVQGHRNFWHVRISRMDYRKSAHDLLFGNAFVFVPALCRKPLRNVGNRSHYGHFIPRPLRKMRDSLVYEHAPNGLLSIREKMSEGQNPQFGLSPKEPPDVVIRGNFLCLRHQRPLFPPSALVRNPRQSNSIAKCILVAGLFWKLNCSQCTICEECSDHRLGRLLSGDGF